jgi:shikimate dehydrogenase
VRKQYGLIGRNISYSFSKKYFSEKFQHNRLDDHSYENFDLREIAEFPLIIKNNRGLAGLNVTIPYKETVIPFLDTLSKKAKKIGAVNTIRFTKSGKLKGYNTDWYGFSKALLPLLKPHHKKALLLGTGGASKAVAFALKELGIKATFVSRVTMIGQLTYDELDEKIFQDYPIIINCTPLGTSPDVEVCPDIPYALFTPRHIAFDLIYNPAETLFLQKAKAQGAVIKNGLEMLAFQAEKAWKIWNK